MVQDIGDCLEIPTDVKNTGNTEFYEEAFEDNINENVANTEDASKSGNDMIGVKICVDSFHRQNLPQ